MIRAPLLALVAVLASAGCGFDERVAPDGAPGERTYDGWTVEVTVGGPDLGPLVVSARPPDLAPPTDAEAWLQHELVFENHGKLPLTFADTRTSVFIGPGGERPLLVADEGCGYALPSRGAPLVPGACARYLDLMTVRPGGRETRTVTLFKDLGGTRLVEGTYVWERHVRFAPGRRIPSENEGRDATIRVVYEISRAQA